MYRKIVKLSSLTLTLMIVLSSVALYSTVYSQARQRIYVDPAVNEYTTDTTSVGATFTVAIKSADWVAPGVFSYQLKLFFDPTMLNATAAEIPENHWFKPVAAGKIFIVDSGTIDPSGFVSFAASLLSPEAAKLGGGTIATVTFQIIASPPAGGSLSSNIELKDVILVTKVDSTATPVSPDSFDLVAATFFYGSPPPPWYLKVEPALATATTVGDQVKVDIKLYNATVDGKIVGVQFRLQYPNILKTSEDMISEGALLKSLSTASPPTFFTSYVDGKSAFVMVIMMPPWTKFVEGSGTIATITFNVTAVPEKITTFPLTLTDVTLVDPNANAVPYWKLVSGAIMAPAKAEDLNGDGNVDITDMTIWALAFGTSSESSRWNPKADLNNDGTVNILDGVMIALLFGFKA